MNSAFILFASDVPECPEVDFGGGVLESAGGEDGFLAKFGP